MEAQFATCPGCLTVVDLHASKARKLKFPARAGRVGFVQTDVMCPRCGGLVSRKIDGKTVRAKGEDPRSKIAAVEAPPTGKPVE
jgi:hypothetical protein